MVKYICTGGGFLMKRLMSVFIDESGDFGFVGDASKYYVITFVFHDQKYDISANIDKIKDRPVFHAGPIIRREYPFQNETPLERKKLFQSIFIFSHSLPIKTKSFSYYKKEFNNDTLKMQARMSKDLYSFFYENRDLFEKYKLIIYYDNGQNLLTRLLNFNLATSAIDYEFKKEVHARDYRLYQVADFITTLRLLEIKMNNNELSKTEKMLIDRRNLKNVYLRTINKKEL